VKGLDDYHVQRETSLWAREQLARFVESALGSSDITGLMYPLQPVSSIRWTRNPALVGRAIREFDGRKGDAVPRTDFEQGLLFNATTRQISRKALEALISRMGSLKEGRKALILVSEGYDYASGLSGFSEMQKELRWVWTASKSQ
jgi:hypothetical protein